MNTRRSKPAAKSARDPAKGRDPLRDTVPPFSPAIDDAAPPIPPAQRPEVLIVTGLSGAGRSRAANALEDLDWYVIDNLPPQ